MPPKPFKPPRPVSSTSSSTTTKAISKPTRTVSAPATTAHRAATTSKSKAKVPAPVLPLLSDSEDNNDEDINLPDINISSDDDDSITDQTLVEAVIPAQLIARLLHEHFTSQDTRITKEALEVVCKYVDVFAREAVARCCFGKEEEEGEVDFLEVTDLEKLAPQLLLDF